MYSTYCQDFRKFTALLPGEHAGKRRKCSEYMGLAMSLLKKESIAFPTVTAR
jgi:hypothetical protein